MNSLNKNPRALSLVPNLRQRLLKMSGKYIEEILKTNE